jgi:hypothetical protein
MRRNINLVAQIAVILGLLAALLLPGCSPDDKAPMQPGNTSADTAAVSEKPAASGLADALTSWQAGNQDQAVKEFVNIDWNKTTALPESFALKQNKAEFNAMDETKQIQQMTKALSEIGSIKTLCAYVLDGAPASADPKKYYNAVLKFADMLANQKDTMIPLNNISEDLKKLVEQAQAQKK